METFESYLHSHIDGIFFFEILLQEQEIYIAVTELHPMTLKISEVHTFGVKNNAFLKLSPELSAEKLAEFMSSPIEESQTIEKILIDMKTNSSD